MENNIGKARRLYEKATGRKFTQDDAAREFDTASSTYKRWEQGIGRLNGEILCMIADKYGCSTDFLLCKTNDPTPYPTGRTSQSLGSDEARLIRAYRECTQREKSVILITAETMADKGLAKNTDISEGEQAIGA